MFVVCGRVRVSVSNVLRAGLGLVLAGGLVMAMSHEASAQQKKKTNYDEAAVGDYTLPDPLRTEEGRAVTSAELWNKTRRPELLRLFESQVYGKTPEPAQPIRPTYEVISEDREALGGKAIRREVSIRFTDKADGPHMDLLIYTPKNAAKDKPVPAFLGLNFKGNQSINADPGIRITTSWMRPSNDDAVVDNRSTEASRGVASSRWPVDRIIERGYALATAYYGDLDSDADDGFKNGVHRLFYREGQTLPDVDQWGSIGAWAWGLSRGLDYLETLPEVDAKKVAVMGHSRLGKTSLWAGAQDPRFALVISNNSGEGGAALARRDFGETTADLNNRFPHWFCGNFKQYSDHPEKMPVDQHELIALIAPRPVLVSSAEEDRWADPKGEFLSCKGADPVYRLLGTDGLKLDEWPKPAEDSLSLGTIGYRYRPGKHDVTASDWEAYMNFADHHYGR